MTLLARTLAGLALASLALGGCGSGDDAGGGSGRGAVAQGRATGDVEVWAMGSEGEALVGLAEAFEEDNPDADVTVTVVPWASAREKVVSAIASGRTPDVTLVGTTWLGELVAADGLMPTPEDLVDPTDFYPGAWQSTEVGGTSYGVPGYVEARALYYRTDLARKAGWTSAPSSWDELERFARDLQQQGGAEHGISLPPGQAGAWQTFLPFAWSNGATLTDEAGTAYTLDSPPMGEALDFYASFFRDGLSSTSVLGPAELADAFAAGVVGSFVSGPWHAALVEDAGLSPSAYAVAPLPGRDGGTGTSSVAGGDLAVLKDAHNPDAAWKLVRWLSRPDVQQRWYAATGDLPAVRSAWESGELATDPHVQVFGEQLGHAQAPPAVPTWQQVAAVIDEELEQVALHEVEGEDAAARMAAKATMIGTGL